MKPYYPTKELEEENDRLVAMILSSEQDWSIDQFIEVYASKNYKEYLKNREKRRRRLLAQGIIEC